MTGPVIAAWKIEELPDRVVVDGKVYVLKENHQSRWLQRLAEAVEVGQSAPSHIRYALHKATMAFCAMHHTALSVGAGHENDVAFGNAISETFASLIELGDLFKAGIQQVGLRHRPNDDYTQEGSDV